MPAICSVKAERTKRKEINRTERLSSFRKSGNSRWSWNGLKKVSAPRPLMNCADWSIRIILSSRFGDSVSCCDSRNPPSTTSRCRSGPKPSGSWRGSMPATWQILLQAAAAWSTTWPQTGSRWGETGYDTSCGAWGYGLSTRNPGPLFPAIRRYASHALLIWRKSRHRMGRDLSGKLSARCAELSTKIECTTGSGSGAARPGCRCHRWLSSNGVGPSGP